MLRIVTSNKYQMALNKSNLVKISILFSTINIQGVTKINEQTFTADRTHQNNRGTSHNIIL